MQVLHVVASLNSGGVESLLRNYYSKIDINELKFDFVVHGYEKGILEPYFIERGCQIYHINSASSDLKGHFAQIRNILKKKKYDIIHVHQGNLSWPILFIAKKYGVKIRIAHAHQSYRNNYSIKNKLYTFLTDISSTELWACGNEAGHQMWGDRTFYLMRNAIDIALFKYDLESRNCIRNEFNISEGEILIGHIGRFTYQKNHEFIIEIAKCLKTAEMPMKIMLIGDGPDKERIENMAKCNNLYGDFIFAGTRYDINKCLSALDVFILPSRFEGLPVVMVEAQSNGLPIIASDQITKEIKLFDNVLYLPIDNPHEWAKKVAEYFGKRVSPNKALEVVRHAGYDINDAVNEMVKKYYSYK